MITDILINGPGVFFVEKSGRLESIPSPFPDVSSLLDLVERLLVSIGKRVDASQPYADGRLADGSRFHLILPPVATKGPYISIRKFRSTKDCLDPFGPPDIVEWLIQAVDKRRNILIAGGTGSGKTTLLSFLLDTIPPDQRIAIIEETAELQLNHPHVVSLESRPASTEGKGEISLRALIRNSLRMRPDRLVLGECRGEEVYELMQAMNTGHKGSLCTLHANGGMDALKRLETLLLLVAGTVPHSAIREWISSTIDLVVFLERTRGTRCIVECLEIRGLEGALYRIQPRYQNGKTFHLH